MKLTAMRYKSYVWPYNPRTYIIDYERRMAVHKVPFGTYQLQDLGLTRRVMRGEGEFTGEGAYEEFKKLASVFYDKGPGALVHPVWQVSSAYFVDLRLKQEPRADYVRYAFTFWEAGPELPGTVTQARETAAEQETAWDAQYHTVGQGETLWGIAQTYGVALSEVIARNPQLKNPNLIVAGERVRIR